jgi:hypothetical protein
MDMDDEQVLILRAQANKVAYRVGRVRKLAERWIEDVWVHEEMRLGGFIPCDPVAARRYGEYENTRPSDRCDVSPKDPSYPMIGGRVWAEIERLLVASIFTQAAFYDGPGGPGNRVKRLQEIVDAAIADGKASALDEAGDVPDCAATDDDC